MATGNRAQPAFVEPMECTPVDRVPDDPSKWIYEVKLDGYRCCAVLDGEGRPALYSRYGNPWRDRFAGIIEVLEELGGPMVLDGEIVAVDANGLPSFQELQNWQSTKLRIVYYVFDITHYRGEDVRRLPLEERKQILSRLAAKFRDPVRLAVTLDADLKTIVPKMKRLGLEGIIAKRRGTRYVAGQRSQWWLKHRFNEIGEFVIGGYIPEEDSFRLLVGEWTEDELRFVKKLKNGFTAHSRREVVAALTRMRNCPFANLPESKGRGAVDAEEMKRVIWVRPERKVEVEFVERTKAGKLRHASFRRLVEE